MSRAGASGAAGPLAGILARFAVAPSAEVIVTPARQPDPPPPAQPEPVSPMAEPTPPRGARVWFHNADAHFVAPDDPTLHMWCWEGGAAFVYAKDRRPPAVTMFLNDRRWAHCKGAEVPVALVTTSDGRQQRRATCGACGKFIGFIKAADAALEWRVR